jgi:hypothetical protein
MDWCFRGTSWFRHQISFTLMLRAPEMSETSVHEYQITERYIPQIPHSCDITVSSLQMQQSLETAWSKVTEIRLRAGQSAVRIPADKDIFLYSEMSRPVRGSRQRSIGTPPCSFEVKNEWSCTSTPHVYLHGKFSDKFSLYRFALT